MPWYKQRFIVHSQIRIGRLDAENGLAPGGSFQAGSPRCRDVVSEEGTAHDGHRQDNLRRDNRPGGKATRHHQHHCRRCDLPSKLSATRVRWCAFAFAFVVYSVWLAFWKEIKCCYETYTSVYYTSYKKKSGVA